MTISLSGVLEMSAFITSLYFYYPVILTRPPTHIGVYSTLRVNHSINSMIKLQLLKIPVWAKLNSNFLLYKKTMYLLLHRTHWFVFPIQLTSINHVSSCLTRDVMYITFKLCLWIKCLGGQFKFNVRFNLYNISNYLMTSSQ